MLQDLITILVIPIQVAQMGSLPWLLAMLVALNFGTAVCAAHALYRACLQARRFTQLRRLLARGARNQ